MALEDQIRGTTDRDAIVGLGGTSKFLEHVAWDLSKWFAAYPMEERRGKQ